MVFYYQVIYFVFWLIADLEDMKNWSCEWFMETEAMELWNGVIRVSAIYVVYL